MLDQVLEFFARLFDTSDWPPRWQCGRWTDFHGWLYIVSDLMIWLAYFAIPVIILYYMRRKDLSYQRIYLLFAVFILACGTTHLIDASLFWVPAYRFSALVRFVTGLASLLTVFALIRTLPEAIRVKSSRELQREVDQRLQAETVLTEKTRLLEAEVRQRQEAELALQESNRTLQKTQEELEGRVGDLQLFAFVASHDLKEPLRKISMFSSILQAQFSDGLPEKALGYIEKIKVSAQRQQRLVEELLVFSRISNARSEFERVPLSELAQEALADLDVLRQEAEASIDLQPLPVIDAIPIQMKLLFQNLFTNAFKFRQAGMPARIQVWSETMPFEQLRPENLVPDEPSLLRRPAPGEMFVKISVRDQGIGFEPEYREAIFELFRRIHGRDQFEGT
jgi:chemotaxis family two-component system sensor kinase Cph1